ncbi:MAG: chromosome segregation protein SMC, partial [Planctomycetota bacterium]
MKLKKLIMHGFKSFADRTEFEFRDGINVIVGPNGCGKSNVVDAVKWVLGEQRPTSLRGKEMQDVIFSGTDQRKGLGYAEVTLQLDNGSQTLPIEYDEVAITRRLYRSGESEYLINGNTVRLRDVRELMMDSGGGPGSVTVMEQGNIDRLLRADPTERRMVFEEAAGIAKYRARRREAQRKLERTDDNLARLRDILAENETRQRSLKIQAGKARRWREMTEELKKKRVAGALASYRALRLRRDGVGEELRAIEQQESGARAKLEDAVQSGEGQRRELDALRDQTAKGEAQMASLVGENRAGAEKRAARAREAEELVDRAAAAEREGEMAKERAEAHRADLEGALRESQKAAAERACRNETLAAAEALFAEAEGRVALMREESEKLNSQRAEALGGETEARNREISVEAEKKALGNRLDRLRSRVKTSGEELESLRASEKEISLQVRQSEERLRALEDRSTAAEEAARTARRESEERAQAESRHAGDEKALSARREVLAGLLARGDGLSAGTRSILEAGRTGRLNGIKGTLADLIGDRVGEKAPVLDQPLRDLAGAVVVESTQDALNAIEYLKRGRRGRARLIPLDRTGEAPLPERFVGIETRAAPFLGALLMGIRVVDTIEEALKANGGALRVVALSGEELEPHSSIVGGAGDAGAGLVRRNAELAEVEEGLTTTRTARSQAEEALADARTRAAAWETTLEELRPKLKQARDEVRDSGEQLAAAGKAAAAREDEMDLERAEGAEVEKAIEECAGRVEAARGDRVAAERLRTALEREARELDDRLTRANREREEAASRRTEAKVEAARWGEKAEAAGLRIAGLRASIEAALQQASTREEDAEKCCQRRASCLDEITVLDRLAKERDATLEELGKQVEEQRRAVREMQEHLEAGSRNVRELRDVHERQREELERHRLKENELRLRVETLLEQVRRDHDLDLAALESAEGEAEVADPETLEEEIAELRRKIERLGNVNHAALEELASVEERLSFMRREESDLIGAERQLRETIEKIDEISKARFTETFEKVRDSFNVVFRKLFGGGKGEIFLEDPEDVLNSGVEIRVRPPGKELRNMALLSGGEKSLTTVALLFSIYQTKPPPFCLLDEVDAALDESNTVRMCEMLKEFAMAG